MPWLSSTRRVSSLFSSISVQPSTHSLLHAPDGFSMELSFRSWSLRTAPVTPRSTRSLQSTARRFCSVTPVSCSRFSVVSTVTASIQSFLGTVASSASTITTPMARQWTSSSGLLNCLGRPRLGKRSNTLKGSVTPFPVLPSARRYRQAHARSGSWMPGGSASGPMSSSATSSRLPRSPSQAHALQRLPLLATGGPSISSPATSGCTSAPSAGSGTISSAGSSYPAIGPGCARPIQGATWERGA